MLQNEKLGIIRGDRTCINIHLYVRNKALKILKMENPVIQQEGKY